MCAVKSSEESRESALSKPRRGSAHPHEHLAAQAEGELHEHLQQFKSDTLMARQASFSGLWHGGWLAADAGV